MKLLSILMTIILGVSTKAIPDELEVPDPVEIRFLRKNNEDDLQKTIERTWPLRIIDNKRVRIVYEDQKLLAGWNTFNDGLSRPPLMDCSLEWGSLSEEHRIEPGLEVFFQEMRFSIQTDDPNKPVREISLGLTSADMHVSYIFNKLDDPYIVVVFGEAKEKSDGTFSKTEWETEFFRCKIPTAKINRDLVLHLSRQRTRANAKRARDWGGLKGNNPTPTGFPGGGPGSNNTSRQAQEPKAYRAGPFATELKAARHYRWYAASAEHEGELSLYCELIEEEESDERLWSLADGSTFTGEFSGYSAGRVKVMLSDGGSKIILMAELSEVDQHYVRSVR